MRKLYEKIRKDIEKLKEIDEAIKNKELISMDDIFETSIALKKIQYVIVFTENEYPDLFKEEGRFPGGEMDNFNLPDNFEDLVDDWEGSLGEEKVNEALRHLNLQDKAEPYIPELVEPNPEEYYEYVKDTLKDVCDISSMGHFGISREGVSHLAISARQDFVKTCKELDLTFDPRIKDTEEVLDFIYNPLETVIEQNREHLMLDDGMMHEKFIKEHTPDFEAVLKAQGFRNIRQSFDDFKSNFVISSSLVKIRQAEYNPEALSNALKESIETFIDLGKQRKEETTLGEYLSMARNRIESTIFDKVVNLGDDVNSKFIKDFLKDPVATLEDSFRKDNKNQIADLIHNERDNYLNARKDKPDVYASIEVARQNRFESLFNNANQNLNPERFKTQYQGSTFERFLGRTSREWTELSDYVDSWKNINEPRDLNRAESLAENYLRHKFPGVDPKDVTIDMVRNLRGAGADRGLFCLSLVQAKIQANEEINQTIYDNAKQQFDALEKRLHRGQSFSDMLGNDINDNEISNDKNDNVIENNNIIKDNDFEL